VIRVVARQKPLRRFAPLSVLFALMFFASAKGVYDEPWCPQYHFEIDAEIVPHAVGEIGFRLRKGQNEETLVGVSAKTQEVFIDRTRSGMVSFSPDCPGLHQATLHWTSSVKLHIFLDRSSIEVFANDGETVLTDRIYPSLGSDALEVYSDSGNSQISSLRTWKLGSIWE
jgi:fructan beta-fructosidase